MTLRKSGAQKPAVAIVGVCPVGLVELGRWSWQGSPVTRCAVLVSSRPRIKRDVVSGSLDWRCRSTREVQETRKGIPVLSRVSRADTVT